MNNSFNYSNFIEMFMNSDDDFEPYGCVDDAHPVTDKHPSHFNSSQHRDSLDIEPWED